MAQCRVIARAHTDVGRQRQKNEDNYLLLEDEFLYVVADGMGGHASGQLASQMAVDAIGEFISKTRKELGVPQLLGDSRSPDEIAIAEAVRTANEKIFFKSCRDRTCEGMGTTVVAMLESGPDLVLAHVGDSRIYRMRDNELFQITEDHSYLNHLIRTRGLTEDEIRNFKDKNVIMRAVGLRDDVMVDTTVVEKVPGDIYLLCSDGLTDMVEDPEISQLLSLHESDLMSAARALVDAANNNGGKDNVTVMLLRVVVEIPPVPAFRPLVN